MSYDEFLVVLKDHDWTVPNRSFAHREFDGGWQVIFNRMGGKFQRPGKVSFVICVRHTCLRNLDGEVNVVEKDPFSCPFKLTLEAAESANPTYGGTLLNFDRSELDTSAEWNRVFTALNHSLPNWLSSQSREALSTQIRENGEGGYIENLWLEDLATA